MKRLAAWLTVAVMSGAISAGFAINKDNPYQVIIDRNAFGLKPIPVANPSEETNAPPTPPSTITLTGITSIGPKKKAFIESAESAQANAKKKYLTLEEGEKSDGIEVVSIDVDAGRVKLRNGGIETVAVLSQPKPSGAGVPAVGAPAAPMAPGMSSFPQPTATTTVIPRPTSIPTRNNPSVPVTGANPNPGADTLQIPTRSIRTSPQGSVIQERPMSREELMVVVEAERIRGEKEHPNIPMPDPFQGTGLREQLDQPDVPTLPGGTAPPNNNSRVSVGRRR